MHYEWIPIDDSTRPGTTWAELLFIYLIGGGHLRCRSASTLKRVTIKFALCEFRREVKNLVQIGLCLPDRSLFLPSRAKQYALQRLGILSNIPAVRSLIVVPASVRRETDHAIACVAHRLTRTRRRELRESGQLDCKTIYWRVHTLMQWPRILPDASHCA